MNDKASVTTSEDDEIDLLELIYTILHGKWTIIFFTLLATTLAFIYAYGQTPVYKADALLQVESTKSSVPGLGDLAGFGGETNATVSTEIEIIKSRRNLNKAIKKLKLDIEASPKRIPLLGNLYNQFFNPKGETKKPLQFWGWFNQKVYPYAWSNESIDVSELTVPSHLLNQEIELIKGDKNDYKLFFNNYLILKGKVGQLSRSKDGTIKVRVRELIGLPGTKYTLIKKSNLKVIESLQKNIKASEKGKKTGMISLVLEGTNKQKIVDIIDHISKTYLEQNQNRSSEEAKRALKFLKDQIDPIKKKVEKADARLRIYRTNHQTIDITMESQAVLDLVSGIDQELQKLSLQRDELGQKFTPNHPALLALAAQEKKLLNTKKRIESKISKLPKTQQELFKLERNYKTLSATYSELANQIQGYKIAKASSVGNVYIIDTAVVYDKPVKPKKGLILALGALLGTMLGVIVVFLRKALHQTVNNPETLEETTGVPVYATVPLSTGVKLTGGFKKAKRQKSLLALENPTDPAIESLRSLRTSLQFALLEAKNNIVMITGPAPGIGKSFISSNFSAVLASREQKVLLIDADMRKGYLHNLLNKQISPGLSDLISKQVSLEEAIHTIPVADGSLDVITRGKTPPNPSELLMHSSFKELLDDLSNQYDLILIDTPPVHAVTDPTIIGALAGVVFMVVYSDLHSMKEIEHAVTRLAHTGIETKGFIFNGYIAKKSGYGYGYGYHSYYGDYKSDH